MCGISESLNVRGAAVNQNLLRQMIGAIRYRGPDDIEIYSNGSVALAHARLSIIDLAGGH